MFISILPIMKTKRYNSFYIRQKIIYFIIIILVTGGCALWDPDEYKTHPSLEKRIEKIRQELEEIERSKQ